MLPTVAATPDNRSGAFVADGSTNGVFFYEKKGGYYHLLHISLCRLSPGRRRHDLFALGGSVEHTGSSVNMDIWQSVPCSIHKYDAPLIRKAAP